MLIAFNTFYGWYVSIPFRVDVPELESVPLDMSKNYTIQIMTYKRPETLKRTITYLMEAPSLEKIIIIWNDPNTSMMGSDLYRLAKNFAKPIEVVISKQNDVTARWSRKGQPSTGPIFNIDDDAYIDVEIIEAAFKVWRHYPDRLVGLYGRAVFFNETTGSYEYTLEPGEIKELPMIHGMVIGKAWFAGDRIMDAASDKNDPLLNDLQDFLHNPDTERKGCDDIAWNMFLHEKGFDRPVALSNVPVYPVGDYEASGYSVSSDQDLEAWLNYRTKCVQDLLDLFGSKQPKLPDGLLHTIPITYDGWKYKRRYRKEMVRIERDIEAWNDRTDFE